MIDLDRQIAAALPDLKEGYDFCPVCDEYPRDTAYSKRMSAAWRVVEEMERRHKLDFSLDKAFNTGWFATFTNEPTSAKLRMHGDGRAATAAEAICRAALEALKND